MTTATELDTLRALISDGCRVLAARGLADGILGHISARVGAERLLVRCRGPRERGLLHDPGRHPPGGPRRAARRPGRTRGRLASAQRTSLHTEVLRTRTDVDTVVHAHPPAVVAADLAGLRIRPIIGAYDIPGTRLAAGGVPVYPRGVLVRDRRLAAEMVAALGSRPVVVLRGHGLTSTGQSVQEAVLRAVSVDGIARLSLDVAQAGGVLTDLPDEDLAELPDLGGTFNLDTAWRHELARLEPVR